MSDDIVARLRQLQRVFGDPTSLAAMAADEIERLRKERDEARRELCMMRAPRNNAGVVTDADFEAYALNRGWNCFEIDDEGNGGLHGEQPKQG